MKIMKKLKFASFRNINYFFIVSAFLLCNYAFSQEHFDHDSAKAIIKNYINEHHIPGFAVGIIKNDKIIWSDAQGKANIEKDIPMSIDAIMNIASISKTITATASMQLWEKELIDLDTDINDYLPISIRNPNFPDEPITIQQILTHTSSINDGSAYSASYACGDPKMSLKYWINNYLLEGGKFYNKDENFHDWKPGSKYDYSNVAFGLLGYIIEEVSKIPFNEYCKKNIFKPLEMNNTGWFISEIDTLNHIIPYIYIYNVGLLRKYPKNELNTVSTNCPLCYYSFPNYPDGLVRTSVSELSHFLIAIMNNGVYKNVRILKESTIKKMLTLQIKGDDCQGLCWEKESFESLWGHSGGDPGVSTDMYFNPDTKTGVITFQNNNNGNLFKILKKLYLLVKNQKE
jgi:CubicO group peptidase (beta-lactamase class C family)